MSEGGQGRARGRAQGRGRSRGVPPSQPSEAPRAPREAPSTQPGQAQQPQPQPGQAQQKPVQTARGRAAQQQQQAAQQRQQLPSVSYQQQPEGAHGLAPGIGDISGAFRGLQIGETKPGQALRRGALRGRTEVVAPVITKPTSVQVKKGTGGQPIKVTSNHFRLLKTTDWSLYQYRVDFSPEEDRNNIRKALLKDHKSTLLGEAYMFDGSMLFTIRRLPQDKMEVFSTRDSDKEKIRITIKFTNELALGDYMYIQLFNIILRNCIDLMDFQLVGREYFDPNLKTDLRQFNLEIWPGYVTSILQFEDNIMMCVDVSHKVLRKDTVLELISECKRRYRDDWKDKFTQAILGNVVFTHYNNKPYRVDDVDFSSNPYSTFKKGDKDVMYVTYYQEKYQIPIRDKEQPLLISRPKARDVRGGRNQNIVLVPELCNMTGLSNEMRSNFNLMRAVAEKTRIPPAERIRSYGQFLQRMKSNTNVRTKLQQWNMKFADRLEEFPARRLDPERLLQGNRKEFGYDDSGDWSRTMRGGAMLLSIKLFDWVIITPAALGDRRGQGMIENFLTELNKAARSVQFEMAPPQRLQTDADRPSAYYTAIERSMCRKNLQLVMCVVPNNRADIYSSIKKKCCVDRPVPSQVIAVRTLTHKNLLSVATKIIIQMNCKLGGAPWFVPIPFRTPQQTEDPTMIVGFDVCHDTAKRGQSFGAVVASLDYYFTKFYSAVSAHSFGEELSNDIATHITHAVMRFRELNGKLPTRLIIYRDSVGESNVPFVLDHEVAVVKQRLSEMFPNGEFKMAVVVVSKRIQTRIFMNNDNPKPGTVVDDVITQPEKYDFFLVSQSVRQGTVTPTSYNVIYDTTGLKPDIMQKLTYKMTHMYYNCSATVRVPAQVQYAHKLAFLVGQSIHQCPSVDMNSFLYFL